MTLPGVLLISAVIIFICIIANRVSYKIGVPTLLLFILSGIFFGQGPFFRETLINYNIAEKICSIALLFIIFYGGFGTRWQAAKPVAGKAILLSSLGTVLTAVFVI